MNTDMIAFETEMKRLRGAYIFDIAPAIEMYRALLARVAELEATLAAQGWRPVTERPPADDEYLVWCSSYEGCEIQSYSKRLNRWYSNTGNDADYWLPLPTPRPAPQEATP